MYTNISWRCVKLITILWLKHKIYHFRQLPSLINSWCHELTQFQIILLKHRFNSDIIFLTWIYLDNLSQYGIGWTVRGENKSHINGGNVVLHVRCTFSTFINSVHVMQYALVSCSRHFTVLIEMFTFSPIFASICTFCLLTSAYDTSAAQY
jgi:hypothetical protein